MILLASNSPRRRELLTQAGIPFSVCPATLDELEDSELTARELCLINAASKAFEVAALHPARLVLGADTVVSLANHTFGKPRDLAGARTMLTALAGRVHEVLTGVCLVHRATQRMCRFVESTRVKFRPLEELDLDAYLATMNPLDKAGAYAAQEDNGRLIETLEGSLSNVVGLPVERLRDTLREHFSEIFE